MRKGWIACGDSRVRDWDLWEELLYLLQEVQGRWSVNVHFWWVPRSWNREATREAHLGTRVPPPIVTSRAGNDTLYAYSSPDSFKLEMGGLDGVA